MSTQRPPNHLPIKSAHKPITHLKRIWFIKSPQSKKKPT